MVRMSIPEVRLFQKHGMEFMAAKAKMIVQAVSEPDQSLESV